jgi:hypothetical protein
MVSCVADIGKRLRLCVRRRINHLCGPLFISSVKRCSCSGLVQRNPGSHAHPEIDPSWNLSGYRGTLFWCSCLYRMILENDRWAVDSFTGDTAGAVGMSCRLKYITAGTEGVPIHQGWGTEVGFATLTRWTRPPPGRSDLFTLLGDKVIDPRH